MYKGERFNSISHLVGATFALVGGAILITGATIDGGIARIVSYSIYATTLLLLYVVSTLYHSVPGRAKKVLRIFDHQAIYLLIAGTYTPFILAMPQGDRPEWMLGTIWGLAAFGVALDALPRRGIRRVLPVVLYLAMGWLCVLAPQSFLSWVPADSLAWLIAGGVFYTAGVLFYALDRWYPWCHGIWHLFVIAGSACHYFAILLL
jgi:hemolysin III